MLDPSRKDFITASQAHRVMADSKNELKGKLLKKPDFDDFDIVESWINKHDGKKPLVRDFDKGFITGEQIREIWEYVKCKNPVFSKQMLSVAMEMAMSEIFDTQDEKEEVNTKDMERGNLQEGEAVSKIGEKAGVVFENTEKNQEFLTKGNLGVTPDGIEYADDGFTIVSCCEAKNPIDTTHMRYLTMIKNQDDLFEVVPIYYWQAQVGLYVTEAEVYHWGSYHSGAHDGLKLVYVPVKPNQEHIDLLVERADRVINKVPEIIQDIYERYINA